MQTDLGNVSEEKSFSSTLQRRELYESYVEQSPKKQVCNSFLDFSIPF